MAIKVNLDLLLVQRKMSLTQLADEVGITLSNMSLLKTGKVRGIRFKTLDAICRTLECQPGDILDYEPDPDSADLAAAED
jgi:putative transcriptional regulator